MFPEQRNSKSSFGLKLRVKGTGILEMDPNVIHPFVRIHICDMNTHKYLAKSDKNQAGVTNLETCSYFRIKEEQEQKEFLGSPADFFLPLSTQIYDMRIKGENYCNWDEEFVINETAAQIFKPNVLLVFEILEFNASLVVEDSPLLNAEKLYPVAWAYLRPLGAAQTHMYSSKLQLFKHRYKSDKATRFSRPYDFRTPDVLLELEWLQKTKMMTFLEVQLQFCNRPGKEIVRKHISRAPWEKEVGLKEYSRERAVQNMQRAAEAEDIGVVKKLRSWEKFIELPSMLPDQLLWKFDTSSQGAFKIKFSTSGKYLAAACTLKNDKTIIKVFDCEAGTLCLILKGHNDLVYDLSWSQDDNFLASASSDASVRIWDMRYKNTEHNDRLNYQENDRLFFITEIYHPGFVYGAKFHPVLSDGYFWLATICFDSKVRIYQLYLGDPDSPDYQLESEMDINLDAQADAGFQQVIGTRMSIYEQEEELEDETLRLLMNPQTNVLLKNPAQDKAQLNRSLSEHSKSAKLETQTTEKRKEVFQFKSMIEKKHPNALTFDSEGRLFVGDSLGQISVWRVVIKY
mmetsp:Transcript_11084/g.18565  ORF Transcript_11084/g.18565 Transcript_11084/m.18565 type:complete len:571 (-) Transcript_11084:750-2462(-)